MIHELMALRRRMMMADGAPKRLFTYTGNFTDVTDENGQRVITLTSSGIFEALTEFVATVFVQGAGGGCAAYLASSSDIRRARTGGGGGYSTSQMTITRGTYNVAVGRGGAAAKSNNNATAQAGDGGDSSFAGVTCTGGKGSVVTVSGSPNTTGTGGSPNGGAGTYSNSGSLSTPVEGGVPNGGGFSSGAPRPGGDGYIKITIPA